MPKPLTKEDLEILVQSSISQLSRLFQDWIENGTHFCLNKAAIVAYWVRDYCAFLRVEETFSPTSVPRLKRGHVIIVDFGFRVGKEFGGRHYAVVLDNNNSLHSGIVTVVPLFSLKEGFTENKYTCVLQDGIYNPMMKRARAIVNEAQRMIDELNKTYKPEQKSSPEYRAKNSIASDLIKRAERMIDEISHMKSGSVANSCQITTISKIRIKRPLSKNDPLYGLRLSETDMSKIDEQVKSLFVFQKKNI